MTNTTNATATAATASVATASVASKGGKREANAKAKATALAKATAKATALAKATAKAKADEAKRVALAKGDDLALESVGLQEQLAAIVWQALTEVAAYGERHAERVAFVTALKMGDVETFGKWSTSSTPLNARRVVGGWLAEHAKDITPDVCTADERAAVNEAIGTMGQLLNPGKMARAWSVKDGETFVRNASTTTELAKLLRDELTVARQDVDAPVPTGASVKVSTPDSRATETLKAMLATLADIQAGHVSGDIQRQVADAGFMLADAVTVSA